MNLRELTGEELDELRRGVLAEMERRANLAAIPEQIEALAKVFRDGGGNEQALQDALTPEQIAELNRA
ncbi:TPA: hypothetical protein OQU49_004393 [Shigella flexneri]|nr:hypothetical protein [Shigella flexneri]